MLGNFLNALPIIGHAKAIIHYATGDSYNGDQAMYSATRTSAVMAGGVLGIVGGPVGVLAGATGAGLATDTIMSIATNKPTGIIEGVNNIHTDVVNGDVPIRSIFQTGLYVGGDVLSGFGGSTIVSGVANSAGKSVVKNVAVQVLKTPAVNMVAAGSLTHNLANSSPNSSANRSTSGGSSSSGTRGGNPSQRPQSKTNNTSEAVYCYGYVRTGSGSQPPQEPNKNNKKSDHEKAQNESHLTIFLQIFDVSSLDDVLVGGVYIFRNLSAGQMKELKKRIKQLRMNRLLRRVIETVRNLFNAINPSDRTFQNFLSLVQFVAAYLGEQVAQRTEAQKGVGTSRPFEERVEENIQIESGSIMRRGSPNNILAVFTQLYREIQTFSCHPAFRNVYSAVYHYFKHRVIEQTGDSLTVSNYYNIIDILLKRVKALNQYQHLLSSGHPRRELVFDRVIRLFGTLVRIRIVLKIQDGKLELSSCYPMDVDVDGDEGDEYIDPDKKR